MGENETARICRQKRRIYELFVGRSFAPYIHPNITKKQVDTFFHDIPEARCRRGRQEHTLGADVPMEAAHLLALHPDLLIVEYLPE